MRRLFFLSENDSIIITWIIAFFFPFAVVVFATIQSLIAAAMVLYGTIDSLIDFFSFTAWIFYGGSMVALIVMRYTKPNAPRPYKVCAFYSFSLPLFSLYEFFSLTFVRISWQLKQTNWFGWVESTLLTTANFYLKTIIANLQCIFYIAEFEANRFYRLSCSMSWYFPVSRTTIFSNTTHHFKQPKSIIVFPFYRLFYSILKRKFQRTQRKLCSWIFYGKFVSMCALISISHLISFCFFLSMFRPNRCRSSFHMWCW